MRKLSLFVLILIFLIMQVFSSTGLQAATNFNYVDAFAKSILFYEASWCGPDANTNRVAWRGPCHTTDGADVGLDLTGGFHDAGDHVKFGLPQTYAASTLGWAFYEFKDTFVSSGQDGYMLNILKHFTDYFLKCFPNNNTFYYQCGDGADDHTYWGPPELQMNSRPTVYVANLSTPAADVCGGAAAALALMYLNYNERDATYANKCLTAAKNLFIFGRDHRGLSLAGGFYVSTECLDELTWAAIWLYLATNDSSYMTDINNFMIEKRINGVDTYNNHWTHCWDDVFGGVFIKLAQLTGESRYTVIADENLAWWMNGVPQTAAGEKYIASWGALRYTAAECMLAMVYYKITGRTEYRDFAKQQLDYILGNNPRNGSYEVGFGVNYPKFPHHRAASGRYEPGPAYETKKDPEKHLIYGALVGGPAIDDTYVDDVDQYAYTEVAIDYNAGFVGAMAGMAKYFGSGQTPESTPGIEDPSSEYFTEAQLLEEDKQHSTISALIHCNPLLPPVFVKDLSFRYFVDLSEYYAAGMTVNDVTPAVNYAYAQGTLSGLIPWDEAKHIYYVEGKWPNNQNIYGKVEFQFRLANYSASIWDPTNDYSRNGITSTRALTQYIPIYINGVKKFGLEPGGTPGTPTPTRRTVVSATPTPTPTPTRRGPTATPTPTPRRATATPTPTGNTRSAFSQIEAESYNSQSGVQTESCGEGGQDVGYIQNADYTVYNNIDFGTGATGFQARVASATSGGNIEIRLDGTTGTLVGTCSVAGTGGWQTWTTRTCTVSGVTGAHNLYLRYTGSGTGYLMNFNWFKFTTGTTTPTNTPTPTRRGPTPTPSVTPTNTPTPTRTRGNTPTPTPSVTPTNTPTPTPTRRGPTPTNTPTPTRGNTPTPTPTPVRGGYVVTYTISDWGGAGNVDVTIKNNTATAVNGWTLAWTFPGNQTITNMWNASYTQSGASVSAKNLYYNNMIAANGGTVSFGFGMNYSGTNAKPTSFTLNGTACTVQ
jgi:endoglucanase